MVRFQRVNLFQESSFTALTRKSLIIYRHMETKTGLFGFFIHIA